MSVRHHKPPLLRQQRGNTLIIALLLVLLLSVFGLQGYQTTVLEERMAGNTVDHQRAFQGAEAIILVAEQGLEGAIAGRTDWQMALLNTEIRDISEQWSCWRSNSKPPVVTTTTEAELEAIQLDCADTTAFAWSGAGYYSMTDLVASGSCTVASTSSGSNCQTGFLADQPKVVVEYLEDVVDSGAAGISPDIQTPPKKLYRITAQAQGATTSARVILEATYER
ncbi:PilX N-terminal domain-containing pilus assembly protein [Plasticicumulans sp.]|uniref:pilus assembly PilX family protein n=1 Tax=Plasticicumulans sp. TaxID=2307179 RepID=UPI00321FC6C9